jgi:phosphopantetheine adenylyltransferase
MSNKQIVAVYSGSFDPATVGHIHVITEALNARLADKIVVAVVTSDEKKHLLTRENAARLMRLALPTALQDRVIIEPISAREAIGKYGAIRRLKGARNKADIDRETKNIIAAMESATGRGEHALPVAWILNSPLPDSTNPVSSTRGRTALLKLPPDSDELKKVFPEQILSILLQANGQIDSKISRRSDEFAAQFNGVLSTLLNPPQQTTIEVQRREGHLYTVSKLILDRIFAPRQFDPEGTKTSFLDLPTGERTNIRVDRIADCITAVDQEVANWAIVSNCVYNEWRRAKNAITSDAAGQIHPAHGARIAMNLGPAGCSWMLLMPQEFEDKDWRDMLFRQRVTVVTSNRAELADFMKRRNLDFEAVFPEQIIEHKGSTERFARDWMTKTGHAALLHDTVATGNTAMKYNFAPVPDDYMGIDDEHSVLLLGRADRENGHVRSDAFSDTVARQSFEIKQDLVGHYVAMLENFRKESSDPRVEPFIARRVQKIREAYQPHP